MNESDAQDTTNYPKLVDALDEALNALGTPTEWHWRLWKEIRSARDRATAEGKRRGAIQEEPADAVPF